MRMLAAILSLAFATAALAAEPAAAPAPAAALPGPAAPAAAPAPTSSEPIGYGKTQGLIPYTVLGPKLAILPIPGVYGLGLEAKFLSLVGVGIDYVAIPTVNIGDVKAGYTDLSFNARVFPWKGRFYVGAALGTRNFTAKASDSVGNEAKVEVKSTYLAPEIGWRFVWTSGFFMGIDLGYQIILSPKTTLTANVSVDPVDKQNVEDAGDKIGKFGLPIISLLQLGFYL